MPGEKHERMKCIRHRIERQQLTLDVSVLTSRLRGRFSAASCLSESIVTIFPTLSAGANGSQMDAEKEKCACAMMRTVDSPPRDVIF